MQFRKLKEQGIENAGNITEWTFKSRKKGRKNPPTNPNRLYFILQQTWLFEMIAWQFTPLEVCLFILFLIPVNTEVVHASLKFMLFKDKSGHNQPTIPHVKSRLNAEWDIRDESVMVCVSSTTSRKITFQRKKRFGLFSTCYCAACCMLSASVILSRQQGKYYSCMNQTWI